MTQQFRFWTYIHRKPYFEKIHAPFMFIAALLTIARTWEQPKSPSAEERMKKMWYIHIMEYYSAIKKNEIMSFAAVWMDLEIIIQSEVTQRKTNTT